MDEAQTRPALSQPSQAQSQPQDGYADRTLPAAPGQRRAGVLPAVGATAVFTACATVLLGDIATGLTLGSLMGALTGLALWLQRESHQTTANDTRAADSAHLADALYEMSEAQNQLAHSDRLHRELIDHANLGFWVRDLKLNHLVYVSPRLQAMTGYSLAQVRCLPDPDQLFHADDRAAFQSLVGQIAQLSDFEFEGRMVTTRGEQIWTYSRVELVRDAKGRPVRLIGSTVDIEPPENEDPDNRPKGDRDETRARQIH